MGHSHDMNPRYQQYIDGQWCDASNGNTWDVLNPSTEEVVATVPFGNGDDCRAAIAAAARAFPAWAGMTAYERAAILYKTAQLIRERIDELHLVDSQESGKTLADARGDLQAAASLFEWYAEEAKRAYGRTVPSRKPGKRITVLQQPIGVVGVITAWNFPAYNPSRSWSAALAAGCTVVARPSEYTPLTAMSIVQILVEAGLPPGVLNLVNGEPEPMGQAMLDERACRKIAFTGSVRVGKLLMEGAARTVTRLSLELGGNAPVLIFPDADLEALAPVAVETKFRCTGQVCVSPQRFLVHEKARDEFVERIQPFVASLRLGPGTEPDTQVGPLINATQRDRVEQLVGVASGEGVSVVAGGRRPPSFSKGYFYEPTILNNVTAGTTPFREEIFGPVMPVISFSDVDEVVAMANDTQYGLAAYLFTNDLKTAMRAAERLEFGMIGINEWQASAIEAPFPGWKQSGLGHECGMEGMLNYMEPKLVAMGGI